VCVCMYLCTYVCMYVCMYVRMYIRMYVCMYVTICVCVCVCVSCQQNAGQSHNIKTGKSPRYIQHFHIFGKKFNKSNLHLLRN